MNKKRFGRLVVVARKPSIKGRAQWQCVCDCGARVVVPGTRLRSGKTKSCGCLRTLNMRALASSHGLSAHPLYGRWRNMHSRCYEPNNNRYYCYGARGIRVCKRWHNFALYIEDVWPSFVPGATLDRVDNDGDYGPKNFRWASYSQQGRNKSTTVVVESDIPLMRAMYKEKGMTQEKIAKKFGYERGTIKSYLNKKHAY